MGSVVTSHTESWGKEDQSASKCMTTQDADVEAQPCAILEYSIV